MDKFILNIVHRPEMVPEYLEKTTGQGKQEDVGRQEVLTESLEIFRLQQKIVHETGLKTTIQMTYGSLFSSEAISEAKKDSEKYGDEIGMTFVGLTCPDFRERFGSKEIAIWLFSMDDKKRITDFMFDRFREVFGFYPRAIGAYYMDAEHVGYIKSRYPDVTCAVATCWEEGPKAYRNANNSWYTFLDGGPFHPWIPSVRNIHCPASDADDDIGVVAIPHLSRDLQAVFDGPGSFYGTHPQNVLRGLVYRDNEQPYLYNLIDQYRVLKKYNDGYSYNMVFVGPGWMSKAGRWEAPYALLEKTYRDCIAYYAKLRKSGEAFDMTMSEFAAWFRENKKYSEPCAALWDDILYGSRKQVFWYVDPFVRTCLDMNQGGAMIDLRPYVAKLERPVGVGTKYRHDASYPYIIQSFYRAGYFTHYAGEGAIKSCKVSYQGEEVDLCACRTRAGCVTKNGNKMLELDPVEIEFSGLTVTLLTRVLFETGTGKIHFSRKITRMTDQKAKIELNEYFTGCYGTTEYPEDMTGIRLLAQGKKERDKKEIVYAYKSREENLADADLVQATIPQVGTKVTCICLTDGSAGYIREGYGFAPMFTTGIRKQIGINEELVTCLKVEKAD